MSYRLSDAYTRDRARWRQRLKGAQAMNARFNDARSKARVAQVKAEEPQLSQYQDTSNAGQGSGCIELIVHLGCALIACFILGPLAFYLLMKVVFWPM